MTTEEEAIQDVLKQLEAAWNRYDSEAWTAHFAEEATFIHIYGGQLDGHAAIEGAHRAIFDTIYKGSHASFQMRSIRFVRPDVAIAFARAKVDYTEGSEPRTLDTRPTMIVAKEQGL